MKTGCNLAESSEEGYGSKRAVLPTMIMMITFKKTNTNIFLSWQLNTGFRVSAPSMGRSFCSSRHV
jgi:hypothetical protein